MSDIGPFVEFIYCAISKWTGSRVLMKFLDTGLPVDRGIKGLVYNKEMLWKFHTYEVSESDMPIGGDHALRLRRVIASL